MKYRLIWVVVCVLFLQLLCTEIAYSDNDDTNQYGYYWIFEPDVDGSVHVKVIITLGKPSDSYSFPPSFPEDLLLEMNALDGETGEEIEIIEPGEDRTMYTFKFGGDEAKPEGFTFFVEFNLEKKVKEIDEEIYSFSWEWIVDHDTSHTARIILLGYELLSAEPSPDRDQPITFITEISELEPFEFEIVFSKKGKDLIGEGERNFSQGKENNDESLCKEARSAYLEAITFYSKYSMINDRKKYDILSELQDRILEIDNILGKPLNEFSYEWTLKPKEDKNLHGEVKITTGSPLFLYKFSLFGSYPVEFNAWEIEPENPFDWIEIKETNRTKYMLIFGEEKAENFDFYIKFAQNDKIEERDIEYKIYSFYWEWKTYLSSASHIVAVIFPENHELLSVEILEPTSVDQEDDPISVTFEGTFQKSELFEFRVIFSKTGKEARMNGKKYYCLGKYEDALSEYENAKIFYSELQAIYGQEKDEILIVLQDYLTEISNRLENPDEAEWTLELKEDDNPHVKVTITLGSSCSLYPLHISKNDLVGTIEADEEDLGENSLTISEIENGDNIYYYCEFDIKKGGGSKFSVEFDLQDKIKRKGSKGLYYYYFSWECSIDPNTSHKATVILPTGHELLHKEPLDNKKFSKEKEQVSVKFEKEPGSELFGFEVFYSHEGVRLMNGLIDKLDKGYNNENNGNESFLEAHFSTAFYDYQSAEDYYNNAKDFCEQAEEFYENLNGWYVDNQKESPFKKFQDNSENKKKLNKMNKFLEDLKTHYEYEFVFTPNLETGNMHVKVIIKMGVPCNSYSFILPIESLIEIEVPDSIDLSFDEKEKSKIYKFDFREEKTEEFKFYFEFDRQMEIKYEEGKYSFFLEWPTRHRTKYTAKIDLPDGYVKLKETITSDPPGYQDEEVFPKSVKFQYEVIFTKEKLPFKSILGVVCLLFLTSFMIYQREYIRSIFYPKFEPIHPNPYVAGPPIRSEKIFFGREDVFQFIKRRFSAKRRNIAIVLEGERKTGKTSILFQIENQRLGKEFVPVHIDMQAMARVNEKEFFAKITDKIAESLVKFSVINLESSEYSQIRRIARAYETESNPYQVFDKFLDKVSQVLKEKYLMLMFDEFEILLIKIKSNELSPDLTRYIRHLIQDRERLAFIFVKSSMKKEYADIELDLMLSGAISKKISFLEKKDALDLMSKPVDDKIHYNKKAVNNLLRLTACQPYFLQLFLQNLVDHLNEIGKNRATEKEITHVLDYILNNPPLHLSYVWKDSKPQERIVLSALSEIIKSEEQYIPVQDVMKKLQENGATLDEDTIKKALKSLFNKEILGRNRGEAAYNYNFKIDLLRYWIENEYPLFRTLEETQ